VLSLLGYVEYSLALQGFLISMQHYASPVLGLFTSHENPC